MFSLHSNPSALLQNHNPLAIITVFIFSVIHPLCNMFETRTGVLESHPPQRRRVLPRLKVAWSGQGRHRFKIIFRLDKGEMVFLPLSIKIRSRYWSHQILSASGVRFSAISAVCSIAGVVTWRLINFRLPAPFLQRCWPQVGFPTPFFQRCKPQVGLFCCLSYKHVKVLRNDFLR